MIKVFSKKTGAVFMICAVLLCAYSFWTPLGYSVALNCLVVFLAIAVIRNGSKRWAKTRLDELSLQPEILHPRIGRWTITGLHIHPKIEGHVMLGSAKSVYITESTLIDAVNALIQLSSNGTLSHGTFCKSECWYFYQPRPITRDEMQSLYNHIQTQKTGAVFGLLMSFMEKYQHLAYIEDEDGRCNIKVPGYHVHTDLPAGDMTSFSHEYTPFSSVGKTFDEVSKELLELEKHSVMPGDVCGRNCPHFLS